MDRAWWQVNINDVLSKFSGHLATIVRGCFNVERHVLPERNNSGAGAIELAIKLGAENVILVGYDMQHTDGKRHWHGDHPKPLKNAGVINNWPVEFERIKLTHPNVRIVNCTRKTALNAFPQMPLEQALNELN